MTTMMKNQKSKISLPQWISNTLNKLKIRCGLKGRASNFNKDMNDPAAQFIHEINRETNKINKQIVGTSTGLQKMPLDTSIYQKQPNQAPQQQAPQQPNLPPVQPQMPVNPGPVQQAGVDPETAKEFIDRLTSVEKKIDRFFNLIERRVVKNAKEINIRIKLNENTDTEQE